MTVSSAPRIHPAGSTARRTSSVLLIAGLLAACSGGTPAATSGPASSAGSGSNATPAAPAATDAGNGGGSTAGTGGGGGGASGDVETAAKALVPPNSTEVSKTSAQGTWFGIYSSTDAIDSLKSFYQTAITKAGFQIISTTTVSGGISWVFATDSSGSYGGAVNVYPSGDGVTAVQVTISKT
ncbi:MAG TPA: hypothetical protein VE011_04410 [Candidatus Dormibacteraeota bacterium]|nr:hypothetical protein [Candidatus Dormibacteraeota bacterium]